MIKKIYVAIIIVALLSCNRSEMNSVNENKYDFYERCRRLVLEEKQTGLEYFFSRRIQGVDEISITYLGNIITAKSDTLLILNSINYSGQLTDAKHGSGSLFIYNTKKQKLGFYYVGAAWAVPTRIKNDKLVFSYKNEYCDKVTFVNLKDSIPKQIFIQCTTKGGDLYNFQTN